MKRASPAKSTAARARATVDDDDDDDNSDAEQGAVVEDEQTKRVRDLLRYERVIRRGIK